jgi:hypothetical protein
MNNATKSSSDSLRFWAPTACVGLVSTAAVSVLLTAVISAPAHSRPAPPEAASVAATVHLSDQGHEGSRPIRRNCFIGQHRWPTDMSPRQPQCTVAERIASHPDLWR